MIMNDELERIWKEVVVVYTYFKVGLLVHHFSGDSVKSHKNTNNISVMMDGLRTQI
jgi:hypothetical protein